MQLGKGAALLLFLAPSMYLLSQEPAVSGAGTRATNDKSVTAAAVAGSKEDPAAFERGAALYTTNCAGCHGATARGGPGAPDLVRSLLVLDDEKGILIAPVLRNGRPDQGMPKPGLTEPQIADLVAWLHVQTYAAGHRTTYAFQDVLTGDAKKGEAYFQSDLRKLPFGHRRSQGNRRALRRIFTAGAMAPTARRTGRWTRRARRGKRCRIESQRNHRDGDAGHRARTSPALSTASTISASPCAIPAGEYHSFTRDGAVPKVEINDPLKPHIDLLAQVYRRRHPQRDRLPGDPEMTISRFLTSMLLAAACLAAQSPRPQPGRHR